MEKEVFSEQIKWFSELSSKDMEIVGEKASILSELYNGKYLVPPGFVICVSGAENFNKSGEIDKFLKNEIEEAYNILNIEKDILGKEALDILKNQDGNVKVAVRISLIGNIKEETPFFDASNFENLIKTIKECFQYLKEKNWLGAIIIQKLVSSRKSGFISKNPEILDGSVIAEAVWGIGSSLKTREKKIERDRYLLSSDLQIVKSIIGDKSLAFISGNSGIEKIQVNTEDRKKQVLSGHELKKLFQIALRIENFYNFPQRVEFSFEGEELFITGAKPVRFEIKDDQKVSEKSSEIEMETDKTPKKNYEENNLSLNEEELILKALDNSDNNYNRDEYRPGFNEKNKDIPSLNEAIPVSSKDFEQLKTEKIFNLETETNEIILRDVVTEVKTLPDKKALLEKLMSGKIEEPEDFGEEESNDSEASPIGSQDSQLRVNQNYVHNESGNLELENSEEIGDEWEESNISELEIQKEEKDEVLDIF